MNEHRELFDQVNEAIRHLNTRIGGEGINSGMYVDHLNDALGEAEYCTKEAALDILLVCKARAEFILEGVNTLIEQLEESKFDN